MQECSVTVCTNPATHVCTGEGMTVYRCKEHIGDLKRWQFTITQMEKVQ